MKNTQHILCSLLFCNLYLHIQGKVGVVQDLALTPKQYEETTTAVATWKVPTELDGNLASELIYYTISCELNNPRSCINKNATTNTSEFSVKQAKKFYQFKICTVDKNGVLGEQFETTYEVVPALLTCRPNRYRCVHNPQCIEDRRKCDYMKDCLDGSDEDQNGGCVVPIQTVIWSDGNPLVTESSIEVSWDKITQQSDRVQKYEIENLNTNGIESGTHTRYDTKRVYTKTIRNLLPNNQYKFHIRSVNPAGNGPWSAELTATTEKADKIGPVGKIVDSPIKYFEASGRLLKWDPPIINNKEDTSQFVYNVTYCKLNFLTTCKTLSDVKTTNVSITKLERSNLYSYHIIAFDTAGKPGQLKEGTFETESRDICRAGEFTCGNPQCLSDPRWLCDNIVQCADASDEGLQANCSAPEVIPTGLVGKSLTGNEKAIEISFSKVNRLSDRLQRYEVENMNTSVIKTVSHPRNSPSIESFTVSFTSLLSNQDYMFRVRSVNRAGVGDWSTSITVKTNKADSVGPVGSITDSPILYIESTSRMVSWNAPVDNNGEDPSTFTYNFTYCVINTLSTCITVPTSATTLNITGLNRDNLYQYKIEVFDQNGKPGKFEEKVFRTADRNTCREDEFKCTLYPKQCVKKNRRCDNINDCRFGSDESLAGGCPLPLTRISGVIAVPTSNSIKITWNKVTHQADRTNKYEVENVRDRTKTRVEHPPLSPAIKTISLTVNNLLANREYSFRVRSINPSGFGPWSDNVTVSTPKIAAGTVGPVTDVKTEPITFSESTSINITWNAPTELKNNSADSLMYVVRYCKGSVSCTTKTTMSTNSFVQLQGLDAESKYTYSIKVYNENGETETTDPTFIKEGEFTTAHKDTCMPTYWSCDLKCISPIQKCDGNSDCTDDSDEKTGAGCLPPPSVTDLVALEKTTTTIKLQFSSLRDTTDRVNQYIVQNYVSNEQRIIDQTLSTGGPKVQVTFDGLSAGVEYVFRVWSKNPTSKSVNYTELKVYTNGRATGKVTNLKVALKPKSETSAFILTWTPPTELYENEIADLKYYAVYCRINLPDTCLTSSHTTEKTLEITNLKRGDLYSISVYTINKYGVVSKDPAEMVGTTALTLTCSEGEFLCEDKKQCLPKTYKCDGILQCGDSSDEKGHAGCELPLNKPHSVSIEATTTSTVTVNFKQTPRSDRARKFEVLLTNQMLNLTRLVSVPEQLGDHIIKTAKFQSLRAGTDYVIKLRAVNLVGNGPWTDEIIAKTLLSVPTKIPTSIKTKMSPNSVQIDFQHSPGDGAQQYEVQLKKKGSNVIITRMFNHSYITTESVTISDLEPGTTYEIKMRAINSMGTGPWSANFEVKTNDDDDGGLSGGEIAGIIIACLLLLIIAVLLVVYLMKNKSSGGKTYGMNNGHGKSYGNSAYELDNK